LGRPPKKSTKAQKTTKAGKKKKYHDLFRGLFHDGGRLHVDEGFTPTKDGGTCLRRLSMFRKEVH